jgi:hypothetical protein
MKAIKTKYLGPTDTKGSRVKATCDAGSVVIGYDSALSTEDNHRNAKNLLCDKFGWGNVAVFGWINNECFWVYPGEGNQ